MIKEIKLPEVSDNVETGDVLKVLVNVGDRIEIDQPLIELETEKATFEVPASESGVVSQIMVKQGDVIRIGAVILTVETNGNVSKDSGVKAGSKESVQAVAGKDKSAVNIVQEQKTDSEKKPVQQEISLKKSPAAEPVVPSLSTKSQRVPNAPAAPSVRRLARELGVDIELVTGTGTGGRISDEDVKLYVKSMMQSPQRSTLSAKPLPDFSKWGDVEHEPMSKIRSLTADSMTYAWTTVPMVTQFDKADITQLEEIRKRQKAIDVSSRITMTSILVKICTAALKEFPKFNASVDFSKKEVILKKYYNIGVAADTDRGLLVPVLKNTDRKKLNEISDELSILAEKARSRKITPEEMEGGNFTISNLGGIGGTNFTPIVYSPQVAILGVSRSVMEPKYTDGKFMPALMIPLSLTYDHRIIDGADAARFLRWVCDALENPLLLI